MEEDSWCRQSFSGHWGAVCCRPYVKTDGKFPCVFEIRKWLSSLWSLRWRGRMGYYTQYFLEACALMLFGLNCLQTFQKCQPIPSLDCSWMTLGLTGISVSRYKTVQQKAHRWFYCWDGFCASGAFGILLNLVLACLRHPQNKLVVAIVSDPGLGCWTDIKWKSCP